MVRSILFFLVEHMYFVLLSSCAPFCKLTAIRPLMNIIINYLVFYFLFPVRLFLFLLLVR